MKCKWGELITLEYGKPVKDKARVDGKYPVFGTNGQIGTSEYPPLCNHPSFILGRKGAYRGVHYSSVPFSVIDTAFYAENLHPELLDMKWAYYKFLTYDISSMDSGSAIPSTDRYEIYGIDVELPDIYEQKKMVALLECLDDKIELNNKINDNLEQQMQAIFLNFVSTRSSSSKTSVESVVLTANTGADAIQKAPIVDYDTGVRCVRVGDMTNNRSFHDWGYAKVTDEVFNRYQLHKNDIIVTRTASLGLNVIITENLQAVYNNGLIRLTINDKIALPLFIYRQFQTDDFSNYIARIESETSVRPNMKINYLLNYEFDLPPLDEQNKLINVLRPMIEQKNSLVDENKKLESIRDTLLPRLMSGELDVSDIDL